MIVAFAPEPRRLLLGAALIFAAALALRLGVMLASFDAVGFSAFQIEDSLQFMLEARYYLAAGTLTGLSAEGAAVYNPKIMPLAGAAFAFFGAVSPADAVPYILFQNGLDSATCVLVGLIGASLKPQLFVPAGLAAAANPTMIVNANMVLADSLCLFFYTLMLLGAVLLLQRTEDRAMRARLWPAVLLLALGAAGAMYVRFVSLHAAVFLFAALAAAILFRFRALAGRRIAALALAGLAAAVVVQPIALRNQVAHGEYAFSFQSGVHLLYWVVPMARDLSGVQPREAAEAEAQARLTERLGPQAEGLDVFERTAAMHELGREMFWETGFWPLAKAWTAGSILNLGIPAVAVSPPVRAIPHASFYDAPGDGAIGKVAGYIAAPENRLYVGVLAAASAAELIWWGLCLIGLARLAIQTPAIALLFVGWVLFFLAVTGPIVSPKYRLPLEPALSVFVAAGICWLLSRFRGSDHAVR